MRDQLIAAAQSILKGKYGIADVSIIWESPQEIDHGDLATPVALQVAKKVEKPPQEIAQTIADGLKELDGVERAEVAGPGYVNVWLSPGALLGSLDSVITACSAQKERKEPPVLIDYSAPNIAKPLGVHHILSTTIGQVLANLYRYLGHPVVGINYIGDWGTQFGKLAVAYEKWGEKPLEKYSVDELLELYVRFHDEAEKTPDLDDEAREAFKKMEEGDKDLKEFLEKITSLSMKEIQTVYNRLQVNIDEVRGEYYYRNATEPIVEEGKKKGLFKEGEEGALIVEFPEKLNLSSAVIVKGDGATVYLTRDIAAIKDRIETWKPGSILYVVDVAQSLHLKQLFTIVEQLGWEIPNLEHVVYGRMRFTDKKMSTRKGNIVKLSDVLDEAVKRANAVIEKYKEDIQADDLKELADMMGTGAVVYGILSQNRKMDIVFDWDRMLSFEGNSAPYLQYTHARARSVLRKAGSENSPMPKQGEELTEKERVLTNMLLQYPAVLDEAKSANMPHLLTNYLFALCQSFNTFYNAEPIIKAPDNQKALRLFLTFLTADVLKSGAAILTIRVPDRM